MVTANSRKKNRKELWNNIIYYYSYLNCLLPDLNTLSQEYPDEQTSSMTESISNKGCIQKNKNISIKPENLVASIS